MSAWEDAEATLGRPLPPDLRALVDEHGGRELAHGNLFVYRLAPERGDDEDTLTVTTAGDLLRSWDWPVPDEMVIFGTNGSEETFGVWVPRTGRARAIVVEIAEVFEDACLAVVGDDIWSFVRGWTRAYDELQVRDLDDDQFFAILSAANPRLPDPRPDPYERGLTAAEVDVIARR